MVKFPMNPHIRKVKMRQTAPLIAQKEPYPVEVEAGKTYWYCTCGKSEDQPFCDGSHKGTPFTPREFRAERSETVYFCGCKHSGNGITCDGTHATL